MKTVPLFVSIPHSGEKIPDETPWLKQLDEVLLMCDVDRYVDRLYSPALEKLGIPLVKTEWHRFAVDLNRFPEDIDVDSVQGAENPSGTFPRGFHWTMTTLREKVMPSPLKRETHQTLIKKIYEPFHQEVRVCYQQFQLQGFKNIYQIDAHSMPSKGTSEHRDPGQLRADIVVSDCKGQSCSSTFKDLVLQAYERAGFTVSYNWPYFGGRVTEHYGRPHLGQHAIQVELNRALYMNESTKQLQSSVQKVQSQLTQALDFILSQITNF